MRPLRILQLMSCRGWSSDAYWSGRLARELQERGHHVTFVAKGGTEAKVLSRLRALGVQEIRTLAFRGPLSPISDLNDLKAIGRLIRGHDVLHVHRGKEHWLAALANRLSSRPIPLIRTRHIVAPVRVHALNRWLYRHATDRVIAVSHAIRDRYVRTGLVEPKRVVALLGGVDHLTFHPKVDGEAFRRAHSLPLDAPVVGVLAGIRPMKGHRVFVEAARRVVSAHPAARFLIVGEGPDVDSVRALVEANGLSQRTVLIGFTASPESALAAMDVAVYPSVLSEGMGRVIFEYMAMGRSIVASAVGLAPEVLTDGETALLVPPGQPEPLARAIESVLATPSFAVRAGQACRRLVEEHYSGSALAGAVEALYNSLVATGVETPRRP